MKVGDRVQVDEMHLTESVARVEKSRYQGTIERIHNQNVHIVLDDGGRCAVNSRFVHGVDACPE